MTKGNKKSDRMKAGEIMCLSGIPIMVVGTILGICISDHIMIILTAIGGLIITALGLILDELESQTELFIAYVEDFVKPKDKVKK